MTEGVNLTSCAIEIITNAILAEMSCGYQSLPLLCVDTNLKGIYNAQYLIYCA